MFDLEKSIAEWRKQMLAVGIKTPVPLDELEIHLREEIEQQRKSGSNEQEIFDSAVQKIGQARLLKTEFKKAGGFIDWLAENKSARTNRILGALWLAQSTWYFIRFATSPVAVAIILYFPHYWQFFTVFSIFSTVTAIIGSIFLFRGAKFGQHIIRILACFGFLLSVLECVTGDESFAGTISRHWFGILAIFNLITIWLLRPPKKEISKPARN
jgi:hypothetical protein